MKLWSHGLGKRELSMDFRTCEIRPGDDGSIELLGIITEPVTWEFRITLTPEDAAGMIRLALTPPLLYMILRHFPGYFSYLRRRDEFKPSPELVERVQSAFQKMMNRGNRVEAWKQEQAEKKARQSGEAAAMTPAAAS